jgi:dCMP deaminase
METENRISREAMYFELAKVLKRRSTCRRGKVGAVLVQDKRIIATGYNGSPPNAPHCIDIGCNVEENNHVAGCTRTVHAEANVIALCARFGVSSEGGVLYCTHSPCGACARLLVSAGVVGVHYLTPYRLTEGLAVLREAGVYSQHWEDY